MNVNFIGGMMENKVYFHVPKFEELTYRQKIMSQPDTMNYNKGYNVSYEGYNRDTGFMKVVLWVFEENERACRFYENHGFILTDKSKRFCDAVEVMYYKEL